MYGGYRGWEFEFGAQAVDANGKPADGNFVKAFIVGVRDLEVPGHGHVRSYNQYATDAARYYVDYGEHPEFAAPEAVELDVVNACGYAGLRKMTLLHGIPVSHTVDIFEANGGDGAELDEDIEGAQAEDAYEDLDEIAPVGEEIEDLRLELNARVHVYEKVNNRIIENSLGVHANVETTREVDPKNKEVALRLASMRASGFIFSSGLYDPRKGSLVRSQRTRFLEVLTGEETRFHRSLINTRDEELGSERRLHGTNYEFGLLPFNLTAAMALTSLWVELVEKGIPVDELMLDDPLKQAIRVGGDHPFARTLIDLAASRSDGSPRQIDAYEHIQAIIEKGLLHHEKGDMAIPLKDRNMLQAIYGAMDEARADPRTLENKIDCYAKACVAEVFEKKKGNSPARVQSYTAGIDLRWGLSVLGEQSVAMRLQNREDFEADDPHDIVRKSDQYMINPPPGRAVHRAKKVAETLALPAKYRKPLGWESGNYRKLTLHPVQPFYA